MKLAGWAAAVAAAVFTCQEAMAQSAPPAGAAAASQAGRVPKELIEKLDAQAVAPDASVPAAQAAAAVERGLKAVIESGTQAEKEYSSAPNLHLVRARMLRATVRLARLTGQKDYDQQAQRIAQRILGSDCPAEFKAQADLAVTSAQLKAGGLKDAAAAAEIRRFAARYADSNAAVAAIAGAIDLAMQAQSPQLVEELTGTLQSAHGDSPEARALLRKLGRHPDIGRLFEAELTRLDGTKLSLPKDLAGKVIVVDFWATWCVDCVAEMPRLEKLREQYGTKGLEIVAISLDKAKAEVEKFTKAKQLPWIQTFDGPPFAAAVRYGVGPIPSVWVIGRDGKVVADEGGADLEAKITKALASPATAPAAAAPAQAK